MVLQPEWLFIARMVICRIIRAVKANDYKLLISDVEEGHLSSTMIHLGNTSHILGKSSNTNEIYERISGTRSLLESFDRFRNHLFSNRIDWDKENVFQKKHFLLGVGL